MVAPKEREDQAYVADSASAVASTCSALAATSSLLMAIEDAQSDFLLQGSEGDLSNPDLWYLDTGATNHMTGRSIYRMEERSIYSSSKWKKSVYSLKRMRI
ncbi:unnamed protein product [Spirodela intermedia]|uniref:Uncharacterized protein n=1 Tax=Spirodela intermedia TaxID=51605 RepID=A0A7I8J8N6_SPIIN|nr:unnamed protein product [Spirodela intermedia]CAA6666420.1 unnamed protein product [Spirodela intermedia]